MFETVGKCEKGVGSRCLSNIINNIYDMAKLSKKLIKARDAESVAIKKKLILKMTDECHGSINAACKKVGINVGSVYQWMQRDEEFKSIIDAKRRMIFEKAEQNLVELLDGNDPTATMFALKTLGSNYGYSERVLVNHQHRVEIIISGIDDMEDEDDNQIIDVGGEDLYE